MAKGTELAKAYVQIVPSAAGIKGSITNVLGGEADAAGRNAGQSIGGKLVAAIKTAIITAGIGKALGSAIGEGAALEQSLGGIETLFKESSGAVVANAQNAYRTAGLSANAYMETVTGFSASLLQGLGGDTARAAEVADMALTDMSDNANKMGTSMELIQYAYQGFAKQNYTMLDNLKLGYGGTLTEMQRLLGDAEKITGIKYDISNLSDVYSAVHVIQGELGITGTTAKEAASTITGSMAAMKSAFKNVAGQLTLGQDVGPALNALSETTITFLTGNLFPAVFNVLQGAIPALVSFVTSVAPQLVSSIMEFLPLLAESLVTAAPQLIQAAALILQTICAGVIANLPQLINSGLEIISQLVRALIDAAPLLAESALLLISSLTSYVVENLPAIIETGVQLIVALVDGIAGYLPQLVAMAPEIIGRLAGAIIANLPVIINAGIDVLEALIRGIGEYLANLRTMAAEIVSAVWDTIKNTDWRQLGSDIIDGLIRGIGAMAGALWDAATSIARKALDAIKSFFGIASPSTVMRDEVGKMLPAGMAAGILSNTRPISEAMQRLSQLTTGTLQSELSLRLSSGVLASPGFALAGGRSAGGMVFNQTINSHDSLSAYELTREAENLFERIRWKNP